VPEENFWTLWCKGRLTEADTPTIRLGATPSGLTSAHLHHPPFFTGRMPFLLSNQQCQSTERKLKYIHTDTEFTNMSFNRFVVVRDLCIFFGCLWCLLCVCVRVCVVMFSVLLGKTLPLSNFEYTGISWSISDSGRHYAQTRECNSAKSTDCWLSWHVENIQWWVTSCQTLWCICIIMAAIFLLLCNYVSSCNIMLMQIFYWSCYCCWRRLYLSFHYA